MRGRGAWSHSLSGPKRAAQTPTRDKEASSFSRRVQSHQSHSVGGTAWLGQETGRGPAGRWVEQHLSGIGHSSASYPPPHPHREL